MRRIDGEVAATTALLGTVLVVGLTTVRNYGITTDEFLFDDYGPKALRWYLSGFIDWPPFLEAEVPYYGPWFQMLTAALQSLELAPRYDVRHAATFVVGIIGLAALLPLGRLAVGRWAGFAAIVLCLLTGNLYGHLFFSPNDSAFLAVINWTMVAILLMARGGVPSWHLAIAAGLMSGLAIATRAGGILVQAYLVAAMLACAAEVVLQRPPAWRELARIGMRGAAALAAGWALAVAAWPWLQTPHPLRQFRFVFDHFANIQTDIPLHHAGAAYSSLALPWSYVPIEFLVRLPEGFLVLLAVAAVLATATTAAFARDGIRRLRLDGVGGLKAAALELVRARALLIVAMAALVPPAFIVAKQSTLYDGIRHLLFIVPMLALLAAWGLLRLTPLIRRFPVAAAAIAGAHILATVALLVVLHPLEYIATNAFAGGVRGSYGRFDLDYWCAAATEALRRLEQRLAREESGRFAARPPRVLVCIPWREHLVAPMFRQDWVVELEPEKADFIIETERHHCAGRNAVLIDEVKRFDRSFAWTLENRPEATDHVTAHRD